MNQDTKIWQLFYNTEFVGTILRYSTLLEFNLNTILSQYFIRSDRHGEAIEFLLPNLSFGQKIDLFSNLDVRKNLKSYKTAISGLRRFQKIRNIVAHSPHISKSRAKIFSQDGNYKRILHDYPDGTQEEFRHTSHALNRLLRVNEFKNPYTNIVIDPLWISLKDWLG